MSLAAFPAFFLARGSSRRGARALVGALSVFVPSMLLSGTLLIEVLLYPLLLVAMLAMVVSLQEPSRRNQLLAVGAIGVACLAKPLSVVLVAGVRPRRPPPRAARPPDRAGPPERGFAATRPRFAVLGGGAAAGDRRAPRARGSRRRARRLRRRRREHRSRRHGRLVRPAPRRVSISASRSFRSPPRCSSSGLSVVRTVDAGSTSSPPSRCGRSAARSPRSPRTRRSRSRARPGTSRARRACTSGTCSR